MNPSQLKNICTKIWENYLSEMDSFFCNKENLKTYYNKFKDGWKEYGPGTIFISKNLLDIMTGTNDISYGWKLKDDIFKLCGKHYENYINNYSMDDNISFFIVALVMTGPAEYLPENMTYPSALVMHCIVKITNNNDEYQMGTPEKYFTDKIIIDSK